MTDTHPILYTTEQAAARIDPRLSARTLERWRRNGRGPTFVRVGGRLVGYTEQAIQDWIAKQARRHTHQSPEAA